MVKVHNCVTCGNRWYTEVQTEQPVKMHIYPCNKTPTKKKFDAWKRSVVGQAVRPASSQSPRGSLALGLKYTYLKAITGTAEMAYRSYWQELKELQACLKALRDLRSEHDVRNAIKWQ